MIDSIIMCYFVLEKFNNRSIYSSFLLETIKTCTVQSCLHVFEQELKEIEKFYRDHLSTQNEMFITGFIYTGNDSLNSFPDKLKLVMPNDIIKSNKIIGSIDNQLYITVSY